MRRFKRCEQYHRKLSDSYQYSKSYISINCPLLLLYGNCHLFKNFRYYVNENYFNSIDIYIRARIEKEIAKYIYENTKNFHVLRKLFGDDVNYICGNREGKIQVLNAHRIHPKLCIEDYLLLLDDYNKKNNIETLEEKLNKKLMYLYLNNYNVKINNDVIIIIYENTKYETTLMSASELDCHYIISYDLGKVIKIW